MDKAAHIICEEQLAGCGRADGKYKTFRWGRLGAGIINTIAGSVAVGRAPSGSPGRLGQAYKTGQKVTGPARMGRGVGEIADVIQNPHTDIRTPYEHPNWRELSNGLLPWGDSLDYAGNVPGDW
jgi:hypothetical protein